ncbi:MAG: chemotaxis protein CheD [Hyphomicrobium sp.]|uniref:chemotaxis protein CheD n=1 Tax=Hyphomicrobium sp. TaxID=82 RepID=UPI001321FE0A|nr:chemotaxis protein CheD [Hyphomicrobium sp.]KAB2943225.1 MAG: chemotaxis protein CheD [Hyphomicrobium sp.]MBZ0210132.1 chemotaxis protein CheD [Hyphomicrobium sp.]MCZ7594079.1 chemotaxis protein CheD [Hyphomicrobium sp.]
MTNRTLTRKHVMEGQFHVSDDPNLVLTTVLGSCVAACLRDPVARIGGMNHFLLPGDGDRAQSRDAERYGVYLMELLVNGLMSRGAQRARLEAKLFGGARTIFKSSDVGKMNANFADHFLKNEGIAIVGASLGGKAGRRVEYWPVSGRARQISVGETGIAAAPRAPAMPVHDGDLELF